MESKKRRPTCFIIPSHLASDGRLYTEVYLPAISDAGFWIDCNHCDPETCSIDELIRSIVSADACFADVTDQSPDVWAAIGYALALQKPLCLVAAHVYKGSAFVASLPGIIYYPLHPFPSDYDLLKSQIVSRLGLIAPANSSAEVSPTSLEAEVVRVLHPGPPPGIFAQPTLSHISEVDMQPLKYYEHLALKLIVEHQAPHGVGLKTLAKEMNKFGLVQATSVAIASLKRRQFVERRTGAGLDVAGMDALFATASGEEWLQKNPSPLEDPLIVLAREPQSLDLIDALRAC